MIETYFPEKLLYYSKIDKYCIDVILKNTYGITDPIRGFNDPLDCFFECDFSGWQKQTIITALTGIYYTENYFEEGKKIDDLPEEKRKKINIYQNELAHWCDELLKKKLSECLTNGVRSQFSKVLRIRSFSGQKPDRTLNNIMFSHYGDSHKGLCYIFDSKKLIPNDPSASFIKVDYLPKPASIEFKSSLKYSEEELVQRGRDMIRVKHEDWEYENEYRLMIVLADPSEKINDIWKFEPGALEGIVLGLKTTKEDEERIKKLVEKRPAKVNIYKAKRKYGSFYLDYENNKIN